MTSPESVELPAAVGQRLETFPTEFVARTSRELHKRFHAKVFTLFASVQSVASVYRRQFPQGAPHFAFAFTLQRGDQAIECTYDSESAHEVRDWLLADARSGGSGTRTLMTGWKTDWQAFTTASSAFRKTDLGRLADRELVARATELYLAYLKAGGVAYLVDALVAAGNYDPVEQLLTEALVKAGLTEQDAAPLVGGLATPTEPPYATRAKEERLSLAVELEGVGLPSSFATLPVPIQADISAYANRWEWLENNYAHVRRLTPTDVYEQLTNHLTDLRQHGQSARDEVATERAARAARLDARRAIERSLPADPGLTALIDTVQRWASWKDLRKSGVQIGMGCFDQLLAEAAGRLGCTADELGQLVFPELVEALMTRQLPTDLIEARRDRLFYVATDHGYFVAEGAAADPYFSVRPTDEGTDQLIGKSASPGLVRGRVRVIRATHEMAAFVDGEILVTNQTTPEFVPIMRKAAAIVTEQGGITSHAAVISRELGIPCVIGTTIATRVLKDGDLVEVDATNGLVRKVA